jgi:hypothetical protein
MKVMKLLFPACLVVAIFIARAADDGQAKRFFESVKPSRESF